MEPQEVAVGSRPSSAPAEHPSLSFPKRASVAQLRKLREKHFKDGNHELGLQVALEVARRDPGRESFLHHGVMLHQVGRYREALNVLRDALRFEDGAKYLLADIHLHLAYTWFLLERRKRVKESLRRAYALRLKPRTAHNYHIMCGNYLLEKKEYRGALREYREAEKTAPNALTRGRAALNQGLCLTRTFDYEAAATPLDRAIRISKKAGHAAELALARASRAVIVQERGQHQRALGMFVHASQTFRRLGKVDREAEILGRAGFCAWLIGDLAKSGSILDRVISIASVTGQAHVLSIAFANRALVYADNEDLDKANTFLGQSQRMLRGRRDWVGTLHMLRARARIAARSGKWREMCGAAKKAERLASKMGDALHVVEFRKLRSQAEDQLGRKKASSIARNSAARLEGLLKTAKPSGPEALVSKLAPTDTPVLIVGEAGTEKTELARQLHRESLRATGPCVIVPCEHLTFPASDLYGHAEGAWSGAVRSSQGYVNGAQGGTLILDSLDQMPPEDQRILIPLFDRKTRAVGGVEERTLDVRIVATCQTADGIIPEVRSRVASAILHTRTLKEVQSTIPKKVQVLLGGRRSINPDALAEMTRHPWEGNMDELRAIVERLVALSDHKIGRKLVRKVLAGKGSPSVRARGQVRPSIGNMVAVAQ